MSTQNLPTSVIEGGHGGLSSGATEDALADAESAIDALGAGAATLDEGAGTSLGSVAADAVAADALGAGVGSPPMEHATPITITDGQTR